MNTNIELKFTRPGMRGIFTLYATNADTGEKRQLACFENLITDFGLNLLGTSAVRPYCWVGSGSTPPVNSNTTLEHAIASTNSASDANGADPSGFGYSRRTYNFPLGAAAGNLSEIGIGIASGSLFSRALIKDSDDSPTTITVLSNEYFSVVYELRLYPPTVDNTFNVVIEGVTYACICRASQVTSANWIPFGLDTGVRGFNPNYQSTGAYSGDIQDVTLSPSGTPSYANAPTDNVYSNNSLTWTGSTVFALANGNFSGGIKSIEFTCNMGTYQVSFTPPLPKDNTRTLQVGFTATWGRAS